MSADYPELFAPAEQAPPVPPRTSILDWLPVLIVVPFVLMFLMTTMPRLGVPFELEWNEGQSGEQAWRFEHGMPLYPKPDQNWVPYMYAPFYHMVWGTIMKVTQVHTLGMGRIISFLATIATGMAIFMIVWDRARRAIPPLFAAFLYFAYFKPSGYWYDLARVDSLAFGLCAWGMYLTLKERVGGWQGFLGLLLLMLGALTKQTVAPVGLYCAAVLIFKNPRALMFGGIMGALVFANFIFLFQRGGNDAFVKYVYTNALKHTSNPEVYFPGSQYPQAFMNTVAQPKGVRQIAAQYVRSWKTLGPPETWKQCGRHIWIFMALIGAWILVVLFRRRLPNGLIYIPPALVLSIGGLEGFAKFGGYMNNFMPLFMSVCILIGLSLGELRATIGARTPGIFSLTFGVAALLQIFQPWAVPQVSNDASNYEILRRIHDPVLKNKLVEYARKESDKKQNIAQPGIEISEPTPFSTRFLYNAARFLSPGLAYNPTDQWPAESSQAAFESLMHFLVTKKRQNEPVWIVHHQWYGLVTGHPIAMNADMVRCAQWAGDPIPPQMAATASSRAYTWIIID
ncbi:MAG: hypothetical protein ABI579_07505, partial [Candidatus Sumerlaeota bacterium]